MDIKVTSICTILVRNNFSCYRFICTVDEKFDFSCFCRISEVR